MKQVLYMMLSLVLVTTKIGICVKLKNKDYVNLILDIYDAYKPRAVTLVYFANNDSLSEMNIIFEIMLTMTNKKIPTLTMPLQETQSERNYSDFDNKKQEISQPSPSMSLILFPSNKAIEKLKNFTEHINLHMTINFILFLANEGSFDDQCIESFQSKFIFSFRATVLSKCYGDATIKKWNPFNRNHSEFLSWGVWKPDTRLILKMSDLDQTGRNNLNGQILRIGTVQSSWLTYWENGELTGYLSDILNILKETINFQTKHVTEVSDTGTWNEKRETWSGAMGLIVNNEVDLILSDLSMTRGRILSVDFSLPLLLVQDALYVKIPSNNNTIVWTQYFKPFHSKIWIAILVFILTTPFILALMKMKFSNLNTLSSSILESYFNVWSISCQQNLNEFPNAVSIRLAYTSIFIYFFIIMALYSASLTSYLTVPTSSAPFSTLEGFVQDGTYKLIVSRDGSNYETFKNSNESIYRSMYKLMMPKKDLPLTVKDAFKMLCINDKLAYYVSGILNEISNTVPCQKVKIHTGRFGAAAMVFRKDSPYKNVINHFLSKMQNYGFITRIKSRYFPKIENRLENFNAIGLQGIASLLLILAGGIILSVILLFLEKIYFNH